MSDPYECAEYTAFRSDRTICEHGGIRRSCGRCESDVQDVMIERLTAENERLTLERDIAVEQAKLEESEYRLIEAENERLRAALQDVKERAAFGLDVSLEHYDALDEVYGVVIGALTAEGD